MVVADSVISSRIDEKIYQVLTSEGELVDTPPEVSTEQLLSFYRWMVLGRVFSNRMIALQRQGRMGTFAPYNGQEATCVGLAGPLQAEDWLIASYRENISYLVKGVSLLTLMKQWGGYITDDYPPQARCTPFQIVLGTQTLHAVGVAQAIKYNKEPNVVVTAIGDGATSEGDFSEALNFAGVFKAPVVFVIQNNGWAISTSRKRQSAAEYFADRGPGFGIPSVIVDGNDVLAVHKVVSEAVKRARSGEGPTLIEAITYRMGPHTTADDPTKYRSAEKVNVWAERDPITRFRKFLMNQHLLTEAEDEDIYKAIDLEIEDVVAAYESLPVPSLSQQFDLVYATIPPQLQQQQSRILQDLGMS